MEIQCDSTGSLMTNQITLPLQLLTLDDGLPTLVAFARRLQAPVGAHDVVKQNSSRASVTTPTNLRPHAEIASVGERPKRANQRSMGSTRLFVPETRRA